MPDATSMEAIRAAVEAVIPPTDGRPGGAELGVHRHVAEVLEKAIPGFVDLTAALLDAYAADVRPGARFSELSVTERLSVLRAMSEEESQDIADALGGLLVFAYGGMYSEWTGYDRESGSLERPAAWNRMGFLGPSRGHQDAGGQAE